MNDMETNANENRELYSGVFWIPDIHNPARDYCFLIPTDKYGNCTGSTEYELNAKSGGTYNHEKLWDELPADITRNKPYDYYPRGRVHIKNGRATIYLNPNINIEEIQKFIIETYNLNSRNGVGKIVFNSDGSDHYKCCLDWTENNSRKRNG